MATVKDVTKEKQAKTVEDVNNQDARTRLWQSLNTTYNNQIEESNKAYEKAISQASNSMLAKGTGRSSFANQTIANLYNDMNKAANKLGEARIADYQNRVGEIEAQEREEEWKQKQFDEGVRQFNEGQAFTREQNELDRLFKTAEREATQNYSTNERLAQQAYNTNERIASQNYQAQQAQLNRDAELAIQKLNQQFTATQNELNRQAQKDLQILSQNWQSGEAEKARAAQEALQRLSQEFQGGENAKNREAQQALQLLSQAFTAEQNALNRAQSQSQFEAQQAFTAEQNALNRAQSQSQFEISQAFAERQWEAQQANIKEQFDYQKKSDAQKIAFEYLLAQMKNGETPSADTIKAAGLTGSEGQALIAEVTANPSPVITWRQAADRAAKDAGYTDRNDPRIKEDAKSGKITDKDWLASIGV